MTKKYWLIFYLIISILLLGNVISDSIYRFSVAGYWNDRVLFWLWFFGTFYILVIYWKKLLTKIYLGVLVLGIVLSVLPMAIPFFAIVLSTTGGGLHFKKQITPKYRVQIVGYGVMGRPLMEIVKNKGLLEKRIAQTNSGVTVNDSTYIEIWEIKDAKYISETDSSISIQFFGNKLSGEMAIAKDINK